MLDIFCESIRQHKKDMFAIDHIEQRIDCTMYEDIISTKIIFYMQEFRMK